MSRFVTETIADLRIGRQSWRVMIALCGPAFMVAIAAVLIQL